MKNFGPLRFSAALAVTLLLAASVCAAEPARKAATVEGVSEYRLGNGLRLLLVPAPDDDRITVHLTYLVGSRHEGYGEKGMAHLLEHLLFKGSKRHPDLKEQLVRRGARWNGTTAYDRTTYYETLQASEDNLAWALDMEADRMVNAFISKADLESEMTVVRNEFEMGENSPGSVLFERMQRLAFAWHNYGNAIIGARSDIERVPIERLQAFYRTWYRPDNAVLIIAGRFDEDRALELAAKHFGAIARPAQPMPNFYTAEPTQDGERAVTLRRSGDTQLVAAMYRVPAGSHPDYPAIDVLVGLLRTAPTGRLHRALVQPGLASHVWGYERALHDPGFVYFGASLPKAASIDKARDALLATLERFDSNPIRAEEVARAKQALLNDFENAQRDTGSFVRALSEFSAVGDWRLFFLYRDRLRSVTVDDVQRMARAYLKPANRVLGAFVPTATPDRARIPDNVDLRADLAGYRGGDGLDAGEAFDPSPANIEARVIRKSLANGIRTALLPKKTRGGGVVASIGLHWGNEQTRMGREAACSLAGDMLMRGTKKRTRADLRDEMERLNATVSVSASGATIEVRRGEFAETLRLVAEMLREPAFSPAEFEELKRASLTRIEARRGDPAAIADVQLSRHLYPYPKGHPLHTETIDEDLQITRGVSLQDAIACYRELFGATGADFAVVGDFDPEETAKLIEELFGGWKNSKPFARVRSRHFDRPAVERRYRTPDKANAVLRAGFNIAIRDDHPDYPALMLANYLLGGSSTARIPARVREKEGLSYSTYTSFHASSFERVAGFRVSAIFAPQNRDRVERAIRDELARALHEGFGLEETETGKSGLLKMRQLSRTGDGALARRLAGYLYRERTFAWDEALEARIAALSPQDAHAALRRHVDPAKLSVVVAGDLSESN